MTTTGVDRLFVPLTAEAFGWWCSGKKRWEVRVDRPRWSEKHLRAGRLVELRRGYSGPALWGHLTGYVHRAVSVFELERGGVLLQDVAPTATWWWNLADMLGVGVFAHEWWPDITHPTVVAFEVQLHSREPEERGWRPGSTAKVCDGCIQPRSIRVADGEHATVWCADNVHRDARRCPRLTVKVEQMEHAKADQEAGP